MKRTTIFLGDRDRAIIKRVREHYGTGTDSAAIRFALRALDDADRFQEADWNRESAVENLLEVDSGAFDEDESDDVR